MPSFDYYSAAIDARPDHIIPALRDRYSFSSIDPDKPANGYEAAISLRRGDNALVRVQWGGNTGGMVQVRATGENSPELAEIVKDLWPEHRVQRADVCEDYSESEVFDTMCSHAWWIAEKHRLSASQLGDWQRGDPDNKGRTLYIGSRRSLGFLRIYEKGKERGTKSAGSDVQTSVDLDHARAECEIKPQNKIQAFQMAKLAPRDFWRVTPWLNEYSMILFQTNMERLRLTRVEKTSSDEMILSHMLNQYGPAMERLSGANGEDWLLDQIKARIRCNNVRT
jgi:DNA relaxase NicK